MHGILVEDDEYKAKQICGFLSRLDVDLTVKKAFTSGIKAICEEKPEFVLLDMTIPTYEVDNDHPISRNRKFGGKDILREMKRKEIVARVVVITQYSVFGDEEITLDQLDVELKKEFGELYKGVIFYNASALDWQEKLLDFVRKEN